MNQLCNVYVSCWLIVFPKTEGEFRIGATRLGLTLLELKSIENRMGCLNTSSPKTYYLMFPRNWPIFREYIVLYFAILNLLNIPNLHIGINHLSLWAKAMSRWSGRTSTRRYGENGNVGTTALVLISPSFFRCFACVKLMMYPPSLWFWSSIFLLVFVHVFPP